MSVFEESAAFCHSPVRNWEATISYWKVRLRGKSRPLICKRVSQSDLLKLSGWITFRRHGTHFSTCSSVKSWTTCFQNTDVMSEIQKLPPWDLLSPRHTGVETEEFVQLVLGTIYRMPDILSRWKWTVRQCADIHQNIISWYTSEWQYITNTSQYVTSLIACW